MDNEEFLFKARRNYKKLFDAEFENKEHFVENMKFAYNIDSGQWDETDISVRIEDKRPYLTMNKLGKFVSIVVNNEKNLPNVDEVIPVDDKADPIVAKIYNEIIQDIEYQSEAEDVYTLAGEHAIAGGFGYWRILTKYCDDGFDQEIRIMPIKNPLMVSMDPREMFAFIREAVPLEEFEAKYPNAATTGFDGYSGGDDWELWYEPEKIFVAEYFEKEPVKKMIVEFQNPQTGETGIAERTPEVEEILENFEILRERTVDTYKVMWYKITGSEILEKAEWPGTEIPIVEVVGHEIHLEGRDYKRSLISDAKDAQKMYNYWLTSMTEKVALTPKAPFVVTAQQIKGHEKQWREANIKNNPYLLVNQTAAGVPTRVSSPGIDSGAMTILGIANNDVKDILGMYESSMGQSSNERSGKAIMARAARSDLGTFTFQDNLRKAKVKTKKIMIDLIPKIYDNARILRLRGSELTIQINYPTMDENIKLNDLSRGRYDLRVRSAVSPSRRQQIVDNILAAMQYTPNLAPVLMPLMLQYLDVPGSEEIQATIQQAMQAQPPEGGQPGGENRVQTPQAGV